MTPSASRPILFDANEHTLAIARLVVFGFWLVAVSLAPLHNLAAMPIGLFNPSGVFRLVPDAVWDLMLTPAALHSLRWSLVALLALAVLGVRPFPAVAIPAVLLLFAFDALIKGFSGFADHCNVAPMYAAAVLAFYPAADAISVFGRTAPKPQPRYAAAVFTIGLAFCLAYSFVGGRRLAAGPDVFWGSQMDAWLATRSMTAADSSFTFGMLALEYPLFGAAFKAGFAVITCFELLTPLILLSNRFRIVWVLVMVPFHVATLFTMNIIFYENILLILTLFTAFAYRIGRRPDDQPDDPPIVFYDGVCGLCNRSVRWIIDRDPGAIFRFAPLQGDAAARLIEPQPEDPAHWSMILRDRGETYDRSEAALRILARLGGLRGAAGSLLLYVPRPIRDAVYRFIASRRYAWFGKHESCPIPSPELRQRLLD